MSEQKALDSFGVEFEAESPAQPGFLFSPENFRRPDLPKGRAKAFTRGSEGSKPRIFWFGT